ncbi:MAG TPA: VWA domain-containing protein [Candidatus Angelobacter sp.]|nr:VWA domain-containing protein [Candidatus Angelobacter sp.]
MNRQLKKAFLHFALLVATVFAFAQSTPGNSPQAAQDTTKQDSQPSSPLPTLKVSTRLVVFDVVVLDHKGLPVTDLKAEDFTVTEEGAPQSVRVFTFQQPGQAIPSPEAPKSTPNMFSNIPGFKSDKALSVLLLDGLNTDLTKQKYVRQEMLKYLEKLPAGQPVAVYALGAKLRLLQDFTTDPSLLKRAVAESKGQASHLLDSPSGSPSAPYLDAAIASSLAEMGLGNVVAQIQAFQQENAAFQTDQRVAMTVAALKSLARALSGYPGRKNLIWVSSAFPSAIFTNLDALSSNAPRSASGPVLSNYEDEMERIGNALSNARVAVYPIDAGALVNFDMYSSLSNTDSNGNYIGRTATGMVAGTREEQRGAIGTELDRTSDAQLGIHSTMNTVAEETGGKAFYNRNDLASSIRDGMNDGSTYYTLGYYPENKDWNGKFRRVSVKVGRPGLKLRYRAGYFALDPKGYAKLDPRQQAMDFGQALSLDYPVSTAMIFRAVAIPPSDQTGNKLVINYGIDPGTIGFDLRSDGLEHASIDCTAQAFTLKGEPVKIQGNTFDAALKPDAFQMVMQRFFPCNEALALDPGDYVLRLGVRDNGSGRIGTANAKVTIPARPIAQSSGDTKH